MYIKHKKVSKAVNRSFFHYLSPVLAMLLLLTSVGAGQETPIAAETIVSRMAEALGGLEKLRQVENIYVHGKVEVAGLSGTIDDWQTASGQHKQIVDLGDVYKQTTIFDGTRGWVMDRNNQISDLAGISLEKEILSSYLGSFSYLVPGRLPGKVTSAGEDPARKYYLLRVKPQGGSETTLFVDQKTFLPFSMEVLSKDGTTTTYFEDWREVNGVKMPFRFRQTEPNPSNNSVVQQQSVQFNTSIAANTFTRPAPATSDFRFTNGQRFARMPIDRLGNGIFVQARINNSQPLWFGIDTGASATILDERRSRALGLKSEGNLGASTTGGSAQAKFTKGVNFTLPGVKLLNQSVVSIPFGKEMAGFRPNFAGILGYDFISRFVMEIDFLNKTLTLYDAKTYEYKGSGKRVPITVEGTPFVQAEVKTSGHDPVSGRFEIDTGYDGAMTLYHPFVKAHPGLEPPATAEQSTRQGVATSAESFRARVERFTFAGFSFSDVVTDFTVGEAGAGGDRDVAGLIGNEILSRFKVIFDYSRQEMILEPNAHLSDPFGANVSGLEFELQTKPRRVIRVADVQEESAAAGAGIRTGDQLIAIDNQSTSSLSVEQIDKLLQQEEREFLLTIKRGPGVLKVKLKTKKRI